MAVSGIGQDISIGIFHGSIIIVIYALIGGVIWHAFVRPYEEQNLIERFGEVYLKYQKETKNWIPKVRW